jgi:TIR domain
VVAGGDPRGGLVDGAGRRARAATSTDQPPVIVHAVAGFDSHGGGFEYDVALSFAGEQRAYVEKVGASLRRRGIRLFYDDYEQATLWGKDLYEHLDWVYQRAARYCVLFASHDYARKVWTTHERRSTQTRALHSNQEYIFPVRFDDTEIPGLRSTVAYVDGRSLRPEKVAELISKKLLEPRDITAGIDPKGSRNISGISSLWAQQRIAVDLDRRPDLRVGFRLTTLQTFSRNT